MLTLWSHTHHKSYLALRGAENTTYFRKATTNLQKSYRKQQELMSIQQTSNSEEQAYTAYWVKHNITKFSKSQHKGSVSQPYKSFALTGQTFCSG
jgi:hypothetical protein